MRPRTRQLISQVSISQTPASAGAADDDADHAVIAEGVGEAHLQGEDAGVVLGSSDFGFGVAAGGEVVLVGFVDELNDAGAAGGIEGLEDDGHVQRFEVGVDVAHLLLQLGAAGIVLVEDGALEVLGGEGNGFEVAGGGKGSGVAVRARRGSSGTATWGRSLRTRPRSTGLSSRKTMASRPRESSSAMAWMLVALSFQLAWKTAM